MKNPILLLLAPLAFLCSCSATNYLTIGVTDPAPVYLPPEIQNVGVLDRSLPSEENKALDGIDKFLSAEGKNLDADGALKAMNGLKDELEAGGKFSMVKFVEADGVENPGAGIFPAALSWEQVDRICLDNDLDALFVLSFYDTDAHVDAQVVPVEVGGVAGLKIPAVETSVRITTKIGTGWRIYDDQARLLMDEFILNDVIVSEGRGLNPMKAVEAVQGRRQAVMDVSNIIGHRYARRVYPNNLRVSRIYYVRGTNNFKMAKRRAQTGNWNGAAELWEKELTSRKRKVAGRANYNMAIISEINGNLPAAAEWASKSYTDYRNKKALRYLNIIKDRIARQEELQWQLDQ